MEYLGNDDHPSVGSWTVGTRRVEFVPVEPAAFIGAWREATGCYETLRPRAPRQAAPPAAAPERVPSLACDLAIAISALLMIFCIPGMVIYATLH